MKNPLQTTLLFYGLCLAALLPPQITNAVVPGNQLKLTDFLNRPKLVVVVVIDQFRADMLTRLNSRFIKPGAQGQTGGFRLLMEKGAYFPFAEYNVLQSMTCPGHAMISTGSTPDLNGIALNEWYDRERKEMVYCAEDKIDGLSPRRLKTSTFGDELKNSGTPSKVIALALKDRSAIMLGGHRADLALWFNGKTGRWETSSYYRKDLPAWVQTLNQKLAGEKGQIYSWKTSRFEKTAEKGTKLSFVYPYGTSTAIEAATAALKSEKLGLGGRSDVLLLSLSNHDYMGHLLGPNSPEIEELTLAEDQQLSQFFSAIQKQMGGFNEVVIALTADHGIPPLVEDMKTAKIDAGKIDYLELYKKVNESLDKKYGTPKNKEWLIASRFFHFYLNQETLAEKKLRTEEVENDIRLVLQKLPGVLKVFTASDATKNLWPVGMIGDQLKRQYIANISGDLVLIPRPFYMEKDDNTVTHMTGFSYDKQVPLLLFGGRIKSAVHSAPAKVIDLAPTLSFILGTVSPATNQGEVLPVF